MADAPRIRFKEIRHVPANTLVPHPRNPRRHGERQRSALAGVLEEIGLVDALLTYERPDGTLGLVDGHLRADQLDETIVPVIVTDLNEEEALKVLASYDALTGMAGVDDEALSALAAELTIASERMRLMLDELVMPEIPEIDLGYDPGDDTTGGLKSITFSLTPDQYDVVREVLDDIGETVTHETNAHKLSNALWHLASKWRDG